MNCPCGEAITRVDAKYCNRDCWNQYRPKKYNVISQNKAWFKPGENVYPEHGFQKGRRPANFLGREGKYAYTNLHKWVKYHKGKAVSCTHCGADNRQCHWANVSHEYKYDKDDWISLCVPCHKRFDSNHVGSLDREFRCGAW